MLKRSICILLAIATAGSVAGCAGGGAEPHIGPEPQPGIDREPVPPMRVNPPALPSTDSRSSNATPAPTNTANAAARSGNAQAKPDAQTTVLPTIPAGARFSIFCESYSMPDHVAFSNNLKNLLVKNTKLKDWYLIHQAGQSTLYHGYYAEFDPKAASDKNAKRDADRAQNDRKLIESIPNPQATDRRLFPRSLFVPLDAPDPDALPAWNLTNAPGFWTVQVAAFTGADRKRQTLEAVKAARAENIPAFYYHGPSVSSVCIGAWDRSAIKEQAVADAGDQDRDRGADENTDLYVNVSGQEFTPDSRVGPDGKRMRVLQAKMEVNDPTLLKTLHDYPEQAVDGYAVMLTGTDKNGQKVTRPRPSMVVMIPRGTPKETTATGGSQTSEPDPTLIRPGAGNSSLGARLKGIGQ